MAENGGVNRQLLESIKLKIEEMLLSLDHTNVQNIIIHCVAKKIKLINFGFTITDSRINYNK